MNMFRRHRKLLMYIFLFMTAALAVTALLTRGSFPAVGNTLLAVLAVFTVSECAFLLCYVIRCKDDRGAFAADCRSIVLTLLATVVVTALCIPCMLIFSLAWVIQTVTDKATERKNRKRPVLAAAPAATETAQETHPKEAKEAEPEEVTEDISAAPK